MLKEKKKKKKKKKNQQKRVDFRINAKTLSYIFL